MTTRHRSWRAWLAAAMSVGVAGIGALVPALDADSSISLPAGLDGTAGKPTLTSGAPASRPGLPPAAPKLLIAEFGAPATGGHGRSRGHRALAAYANGGQVQQPWDPAPGPAPSTRSAVVPEDPGPGLILPAWRSFS